MHVYSINNYIFFKIGLFHLLDSYRTREKISKNPHKDMKAKGRNSERKEIQHVKRQEQRRKNKIDCERKQGDRYLLEGHQPGDSGWGSVAPGPCCWHQSFHLRQ